VTSPACGWSRNEEPKPHQATGPVKKTKRRVIPTGQEENSRVGVLLAARKKVFHDPQKKYSTKKVFHDPQKKAQTSTMQSVRPYWAASESGVKLRSRSSSLSTSVLASSSRTSAADPWCIAKCRGPHGFIMPSGPTCETTCGVDDRRYLSRRGLENTQTGSRAIHFGVMGGYCSGRCLLNIS